MSTIKIKPASGTEYLNEIDQIQLNSGFQASLNDAIEKINDNFKKLVSLPFLQGDNGNSVFEVDIPMSASDTAGNKLRKAVCGAIYGSASPNDTAFGGTVQGHGSWDSNKMDNMKVVFYRHKETQSTGEKYFYATRQFIMFVDNRIEYLWGASPSVASKFKDLSCAITVIGQANADPSNGQPDLSTLTFTATKHHIIPTLYYDNGKGYWCWAINGTETGVIAQGVKGATGASTKVYICVGQKMPPLDSQTNNGILKITRILQPAQPKIYGPDHNQEPSETDIWGIIGTGSLVCVWFKDEVLASNNINNCTFGIAQSAGSSTDPSRYKYISISSADSIRLDLATAINNISLYWSLNDITHTEGGQDPNAPEVQDDPAIRGLYIPNKYNSSKVHMLWSEMNENNPEASIGCVNATCRMMTGGGTLPAFEGDLVPTYSSEEIFNVWYPIVRCHGGSFRRLLQVTGGAGPVPEFNPASYSINMYDDPGTSPMTSVTLERTTGLWSTISLKDPTGTIPEETHVSSSGIYIKRDPDAQPNDVPAFYADLGENGKVYYNGGAITTNDSKVYIGNSSEYTEPHHFFETDNQTHELTENWDNYRWKLENPGVKFVNADAIMHGGTVMVSSANRYRAVIHKGNKIMFDYKANKYLTTISSSNQDKVHDERPRYKDYIGVQLGGYNTIYNSVTTNGTNGKINTILDNVRDPIALTPQQNKEFALLSGKSGYTAMIENWGTSGVRATDPPYKLNGNTFDIEKDSRNWGLITSYNCLWTKVGNVVDVKGKIFLTQAPYEISGNKIQISNMNDARPLTYAELFRHIKRYGSDWAFPLPVVIDAGDGNNHVYKVSTGNMFDNPSDIANIINRSKGVNDPAWSPYFSRGSADIYHNDLFNGFAQFHFYGTENEEVGYAATIDSGGLDLNSIGKKMNNRVDMLNNVFSVTADISRSSSYDDRYWCMSGIPNYDALNFDGASGTGSSTQMTSDVTSGQRKTEQFKYNDSAAGPIRIVAQEQTGHNSNRTDGLSPTAAQKYQYSANIIGFNGGPNRDFTNEADDSKWLNRKPMYINNEACGPVSQINGILDSLTDTTDRHMKLWLQQNLITNIRKYKISVNIGSYFIRYITFSFSYLLDDDIQEQYSTTRDSIIAGADDDSWNLPSGMTGHRITDWNARIASGVTPEFQQTGTTEDHEPLI